MAWLLGILYPYRPSQDRTLGDASPGPVRSRGKVGCGRHGQFNVAVRYLRYCTVNAFQTKDPSGRTALMAARKLLKTVQQSKIGTPTLRHPFATRLFKSGIALRYRYLLLGHGSSKTTESYTHVTSKAVQGIKVHWQTYA